jgi:chitodextrinase
VSIASRISRFVGSRSFGKAAPDTDAPSVPANLAASAVTATTLTLAWDPSTDNVGVVSYEVEQRTSAGPGAWTWLATVAHPTTTVGVTGLTEGTSYDFRVRAVDAAGNMSAWAELLNVVTADETAPTVPANLAASSITATTLTLTWDPSTDNVGVVSYEVEQRTSAGPGAWTWLATVAHPTTTVNVTGLIEITSYDFRVRAVDLAGNMSAWAELLNVVTADETAPTVPANLAASNITATTLDLTWDPSTDNVGVVEYEVQQRLDSGVNGDYVTIAVVAAPTVTLAVTGLTDATEYRFRVRAKDAAGNMSGWGPSDTGLSAGTAYAPMSTPNGRVNAALTLADGSVIIGGNFINMVAASDYTGTGYRVPAGGGAPSGLLTDVPIRVAVTLPDGGVIIGGSFTRVKNTPRRFLARINADGSLHAWNPSTAGGTEVLALALSGTDVIVGGDFTTLGGAARRFIGAVPLASNTATSWNPSTAGGFTVLALAVAGTDVIVGGDFTTLGGAARRFIGAVPLASNTATSWDPSTAGGSAVFALAVAGTDVIVGGSFTTLGGAARRFIGAVPLASNTATSWDPSTAGGLFGVRALAVAGTDVIVGGNFTTLGGAARRFIGAVPLASNTATSWDPSTGGGTSVFALAVAGTDVIVGGNFTTLGGAARRYIGAVPLASNIATSWNPSTAQGTSVFALAVAGTDVIVGGDFVGVANTPRRFLARINADGSLHAWNPSTAGGTEVLALALSGTDVIVGGDFTTLGGAARRFIGAVPLASNTATSWDPSTAGGSAVFTLAVAGTDVIVGGNFITLGGAARRFIGAVPLASNTATSWDPSTAGGFTVRALALSGTDVIVGGNFTTLGGAARRFIGAVPLASNTATSWDPSTAGGSLGVQALAVAGTDVIVGGDFTTLGGAARRYIGAVPLASNTATSWDPSTAGGSLGVQALAVAGTDVIVGGDFTTLGGAARRFIGAVPLASNTATSWNPSTGGGSVVFTLALSGTDVIVGGNFTTPPTPMTAPTPNLPMSHVYRVTTTAP